MNDDKTKTPRVDAMQATADLYRPRTGTLGNLRARISDALGPKVPLTPHAPAGWKLARVQSGGDSIGFECDEVGLVPSWAVSEGDVEVTLVTSAPLKLVPTHVIRALRSIGPRTTPLPPLEDPAAVAILRKVALLEMIAMRDFSLAAGIDYRFQAELSVLFLELGRRCIQEHGLDVETTHSVIVAGWRAPLADKSIQMNHGRGDGRPFPVLSTRLDEMLRSLQHPDEWLYQGKSGAHTLERVRAEREATAVVEAAANAEKAKACAVTVTTPRAANVIAVKKPLGPKTARHIATAPGVMREGAIRGRFEWRLFARELPDEFTVSTTVAEVLGLQRAEAWIVVGDDEQIEASAQELDRAGRTSPPRHVLEAIVEDARARLVATPKPIAKTWNVKDGGATRRRVKQLRTFLRTPAIVEGVARGPYELAGLRMIVLHYAGVRLALDPVIAASEIAKAFPGGELGTAVALIADVHGVQQAPHLHFFEPLELEV